MPLELATATVKNEDAENAAAMKDLRAMGLFQDEAENPIPELPNNALEVTELDSDHVEVLEDPSEHVTAEPPVDLPVEALEPVEAAVEREKMSDQERDFLTLQARNLRKETDENGFPFLTVEEGKATKAQVQAALVNFRAYQERMSKVRALADAK